MFSAKPAELNSHLLTSFLLDLDQPETPAYLGKREATDKLQKEVLKGTRWLLLKNSGNLDEERGEAQRLADALRINQPLATAYYLKEDLREIWKQGTEAAAKKLLNAWIGKAEASGISILKKFARTLEIHRCGILAYYQHRISTGPLEGMNNKIKTMKRREYGYRDIPFFKLKILAIHEAKYALVG